MAEIKDKLITLESLSTLHEYDKETYMTKHNPTGTGVLSISRKADTTIGLSSTTLGFNNEASDWCSYAEGQLNVSSAPYAHVEGFASVASGELSHAEGRSTIANGEYQHVQGRYNIEDTENKYAHIVGNGSMDKDGNIIRSNAHTLDWGGNTWYAGGGTFDGTIYANGSSSINIDGFGTLEDVSAYINNNACINGAVIVNGSSVFRGEVTIFGDKKLTLSSGQYGDTLPPAGNAGRIFFKKVTE